MAAPINAPHDTGDRGRVLSFQRLELVFETAGGGEADDRRQIEGDHIGLPDLRAGCEDLPDQSLRQIRGRLAIGKRLQARRLCSALFGSRHAVEKGKADDGENVV